VVEITKAFVVPFNIFTNVKYHTIKITNDEVVLQALTTSLSILLRNPMYCLVKNVSFATQLSFNYVSVKLS
jgi:hypothetical protein